MIERKVIQLFRITVATLYQDAAVRKIYNYLTGSQDWRFGTRKYQKPCLACNDKSNYTTIRRATTVSFLLISRGHGIV